VLEAGQLPQVLSPKSLAKALEAVPDPRRAHGKRHKLSAVLCLAVCAMLCGSHSLYAIAQWGRDQGAEIAKALGFRHAKTPCVATLHRIFTVLEVEEFERVLGQWFQGQGLSDREALAVDGKSLRGLHGEELPGVHLVTAYAHWAGVTLAQKGGKEQRG